MAKTVVGLFEQLSDAQAAMNELKNASITGNNVRLIDKAGGRINKALAQAGVPQDDADQFDEGVRNGGALIIAQALPDTEAMQVVDILDRHHVVDLDNRARTTQHTSSVAATTSSHSTTTSSAASSQRAKGATRNYAGNEMVVPIIEEELQVSKEQVEGGGVRVQTHVTEKPVTTQVSLHEEEVHVERRPVNQPVDAAMLDQFQDASVDVREMSERAVVNKQARVVEEVVINKEAHDRTENIQDTVRRTDVNVEELKDVQHTTHIDSATTSKSQKRKNKR
ncbi:MAG: YsnF/AvaK domain-containing protein [Herpetosiphonaceae bacterium]|nr:YsnF/AvaK domain-containing protein [Herpetosiphonaceae bacterium]